MNIRLKFTKIVIALALVGSFINPSSSMAEENLDEKIVHNPDDTMLIKSEVFTFDNTGNSILKTTKPNKYGEISPMVVDPGRGAVKINDGLSTLNGIRGRTARDFSNMETFKAASLTIATYIPVVGQWIEKGSSIWSQLSNVKTDIGSGTGTNVRSETEYTDRYFYHWLYVYDGVWKDYGYSQSRYWYKLVSLRYIDKTCDCVRITGYDFSKLQNSPSKISKAPNYMNKTRLSTIVKERWNTGLGKYFESY
ncbi:hypothetical protein AB5N96_12540 [Chryseomicrobium imtechense]